RVEEVVDRRVVEARTGRVVPPGGEDHAVDACPQRGGQAHRARLAAGVQHRAAQLVAAGQPARLTDRHDLGVRGRVVGCGDPVDTLDDAAAGQDDHRPERSAAGGDVGGGEVDGALEVIGL